MRPLLTVGVSMNGRDIGPLLVSLAAQTDRAFELVFADDGPAPKEFGLPHPFRYFHCMMPRPPHRYDSLVVDNIIFREASGIILLHLDDDGTVSPNLVAFTKRLCASFGQATYWGKVVFRDADGSLIQYDQPERSFSADCPPIMAVAPESCCGTPWAAPLDIIREIGGHDLDFLGKRGCDSRLALRLHRKGLRQYLVDCEQFRFQHRGLSRAMAFRAAGNEMQNQLEIAAPHVGNGCLCPVVANGGLDFWGERFNIPYERIR